MDFETDSEIEPVSFQTGRTWLAHDLCRFAQATDDLYGVFAGVLLAQRELASDFQRRSGFYEKHLETDTVSDWATESLMRLWDQTGARDYVVWFTEHVFELVPEARLQVVRIEMASPGGISLAGLGEPLQQVREFIKDLWYRNKQEKIKGELEILREYLAIEREFGPLPVEVVDRVAPKAIRATRELEQLELEAKLVEIPASLDG